MDNIDKKLIQALTYNARTSLSDLARQIGIARTTVQSRIERLEKAGTIRGYTIRMGSANRPLIRASVLIAFDPHNGGEVLSKLRILPEVRRAHTTSGRFDMLVEIAAQTTTDLDRILDQIGSAKGVKNTYRKIVDMKQIYIVVIVSKHCCMEAKYKWAEEKNLK